jgi:hypothetical protein
MNNDPLSCPPSGQLRKVSLLRRYGPKVAGGIACAAFVTFAMHLPAFKTVILCPNWWRC